MGEKLQLALLGNAEVRRDGDQITGFRSGKALALLCYLAVTGRSHARPALAGLLWGDLPEASARSNLRKALTQLRQLVGSHLSISRQAVAFNRAESYWLDVEVFEAGVRAASPETDIERLQKAVELYRGDFLEGFFVRQALAFEEWLLTERVRLRELSLDALHTLAINHSRRGAAGHAAAIDYSTRLLALEPWREEAHRGLMLLLARSDQRSAALVQYQTCRQMLADELGVEPAPETTALYERIRSGELGQLRPKSTSFALPSFLSTASQPSSPSTPIVARERELAQLDDLLDRALAGQSQVVFVTGEAGTGKTALIQEFGRRAQEKHSNLVFASGNCNAHTGAGDPYLPFRDILGLLSGDVEARWAAGAISREYACRLWRLIPHSVVALLRAGPDLIDTFIPGRTLITRSALAMPNGSDWLGQLQELVDQKKGGSGRAGLKQSDLAEQYRQVLEVLAREGPLLLVIDDLQWIDVGSINLLFHLGRRLKRSRILIAGLYRPADLALGRLAAGPKPRERHPLVPVVKEFQRHFGRIRVDLKQIGDRQFVQALVDTEPNQLGAKFREALYQQTKGHALFTVEMLHGMQERGDLVRDERGRWIEGSTLDWQTLPARIDGIIGERIGRLPARLQAALKVASVEGENFTAEVTAEVRAVSKLEMVQQLSNELDKQHRLVRGHGCQRLGFGGHRLSCYQFRHILFQRYLYHSLDEAERAYLHEAVGHGLEALYEDHLEEMAIHLARHFRAAGLVVKATNYLRLAGERARRLSANEEAIGHFTQALELLETLPDTSEFVQQELTLQLALAVALTAARGYAAPEVGQAYERARELCRQVGVNRARDMVPEVREFPELMGLSVYIVGGQLQSARELAERALRSAEEQQNGAFLLQCHFGLGHILFHLGKLEPARAHLEQCLNLYDPQQPAHTAFHLQNPKVTGLSYAAWCLWHLGYPDQALERSHRALTLAQELCHPYSLAYALNWAARLHLFRREWLAVQERAEAAIALSTEQGFTIMLAFGMMLLGTALAAQGEIEEGIANLRQGLVTHRSTGAEIAVPYFMAELAVAYANDGQLEQALNLLADAIAAMERTNERFGEAELYRLKGELLLNARFDAGSRNDPRKLSPEACFLRAIEIACRQQAKALELRTVISLSRLWQRQGKSIEARQILSKTHDWFSEGFNTPDLIEAKKLLDTFV